MHGETLKNHYFLFSFTSNFLLVSIHSFITNFTFLYREIVLRAALYSLIRACVVLHRSQDKVKAKNGLWSGQFRNPVHTKRMQEL